MKNRIRMIFCGLAAAVFLSGVGSMAVEASAFAPIDFSAHHNRRMQDRNSLFPQGLVTVHGVPFDIPIGVNNEWGSGAGIGRSSGNDGAWSIDISVGVARVQRVYTLINTDWGMASGGCMSLEFFGSDGAYFEKDLIGDDDIRDWSAAPAYTTVINGTTTTNEVMIPNGADGNPDYLDMQRFELPGNFHDETLTMIRITDHRTSFGHSGLLSGVTVEAPEPVTLAFLLVGSVWLLFPRRRRRRSVEPVRE